MQGSVVILAGKPPRSGTILDGVQTLLMQDGVPVRLELPRDAGLRPEEWPDGALVVHRGLSRDALRGLITCEERGWACCNGATRSLEARDRGLVLDTLAGAGLAIPRWQLVDRWQDALDAAAQCPVVVKAADGASGRGTRVLTPDTAPLPRDAPFPGLYLVEWHVPNEGLDRKLYVAGSSCFGLLKPWPRVPDTSPKPFPVGEDLRRIAHAAGAAMGLEIFGVDVVVGSEGPVVVDIKVFPGFRGIDGAAEAVTDHLRARLQGLGG